MNNNSFLAILMTLGLGACLATEDDDPDLSVDESEVVSCSFGFGPQVSGPIEEKYRSLGGCWSFLGPPVHELRFTPDGKGHFQAFMNGSIYWRPDLGAHVVRGEIRELWKAFSWERGVLGYPVTDELVTPNGRGRFNVFEGGSVYWSPATGAHEVFGAIRNKWRDMGWELGALGFPTSGEYDVPGGKRSNFEHGMLTWTRETGRVEVQMY